MSLSMPVALAPPDERRLLVAASAAAIVAGALTIVGGFGVALALSASFIFVIVAKRPELGAYLYLGALPFVTGISRGTLVPLLRPNEALQVFLTVAVLAGLYVRFGGGENPHLVVTRLDRALIALAVVGSAWPIAWQLARTETPTMADVMSTVPLIRLGFLYVLVRFAVTDARQLRTCLWILFGGAGALAAIATLESLGLLTLGSLWTADNPVDSGGRGYATLSSAIAVGDYLACALGVALAWILRMNNRRPALYAIVGVLLLGSLGTGQFSAWIATAIVVLLIAGHERQLRRLAARSAPIGAVGLVLTWPVIAQRLSGFSDGLGVPSSWLGRADNITNFYFPALGGFRWVLGIRPDTVLSAPETWREVIYLESGLLWFVFVGGIPLLLAALWFLKVALAHCQRVSANRTDEVGVVAVAAWASLWAFAVLSIIDIHLTLRGAGDLLFILLALSSLRFGVSRRPIDVPPASPESAQLQTTEVEP